LYRLLIHCLPRRAMTETQLGNIIDFEFAPPPAAPSAVPAAAPAARTPQAKLE